MLVRADKKDVDKNLTEISHTQKREKEYTEQKKNLSKAYLVEWNFYWPWTFLHPYLVTAILIVTRQELRTHC